MEIFIQASIENKKSLLILIEEQQIYLPSDCMKKGICGNCSVQIIKGTLAPTSADIAFFTKQELDSGFRLACTTIPKEDILIHIPSNAMKLTPIETTITFENYKYSRIPKINNTNILIDLGTTTIALFLSNADLLKTPSTSLLLPNAEIPYGTDVISRLQYANNGNLSFLSALIREQLKSAVKQLLLQNNLTTNQISHCYIAGNTSMIHLLMEYPCQSLISYPFSPFNQKAILRADLPIPTTIFPCISGFVGGDIVAGLYALDFEKRTDTALLIDCGTNGEIALVYKGKSYVTSVAAGPAMEGGNLSCGGASVAGAITNITLGGIMPKIKTIQNKLPIHLCGTGAISCIAELLKNHYIDEFGLPTKKFSDESILLTKTANGQPITFNMDDVRQMQLALSSLRAGYETLFYECGITPNDIDHIYLAGGFGCQINLEDAFICHLFPYEWKKKITFVGNSCLAGLYAYSLNEKPDFLEQISSKNSFVQTVSLAENDMYQSLFIKHMSFT